jgi:hypothetical protein
MTDDRPRPQYGEFATPEQQAAAMGRRYVPPPAAETRVEVPAAPAPGQGTSATSFRLGGNLIDRFITIFQLGIGLVFLLSSDYFHLAEISNIGMQELGLSQRVPLAIDHYGWLLLSANILVLGVSFVWAYARLRRGRLAFFVPLVGYFAFVVILAVTVSAVR